MKKVHLTPVLCFLSFIISNHLSAQGPDCTTAALAQVLLPYTSPVESTCFMRDDYNDGNMTETCTSPQNPNAFKFTKGADKLYAFTPAENGSIIITLTTNSAADSSGLFVFIGCPDIGDCIANNIGATNIKNLGILVTAGKTYYVMVDRALGPTPADTCILNYSLSISAPDPYCPKFITSTGNSIANLDFEKGKFTSWEGRTGTCCEINTPTKGIVNGRQTITKKSDGDDPYADEAIPQVAPGGGKFSARLGNEQTGAQAEKLSYKFKVTDQSNALLYKYAIVLQDGGHDASQQPRFEIKVLDNQNKVISCGKYKVVVSAATPCFQPSNTTDVYFKEWTTVGVDLSKYIGQLVTVEYATGDCSQGGHFGYAYLDVSATKLEIQTEGSGFCEGQGMVKLTAPPGFAHYTWSGPGITEEDTFQVVEVTPVPSATYTVQLASIADKSCLTPLSITLNPAAITADFSADEVCVGNPTTFTDLSKTTGYGASVGALLWDFGDGERSDDLAPSHMYEKPGTYTVKLLAKNNMGCKDSIAKTIIVYPPLQAPEAFCGNQSLTGVEFSWVPVADAVGYEISTDEGETWVHPSSGFSMTSTKHVMEGLNQGDTVSILVRTNSLGACKNSLPDTVTCYLLLDDCKYFFNIPNAFSPNGDTENDLFYGEGDCIAAYSLKIFNRWGQEIFFTEDRDPAKGWNGGWDNHPDRKLPVGAYIYVAKVKDFAGNVRKYVGIVSLTE